MDFEYFFNLYYNQYKENILKNININLKLYSINCILLLYF